MDAHVKTHFELYHVFASLLKGMFLIRFMTLIVKKQKAHNVSDSVVQKHPTILNDKVSFVTFLTLR